MKDDDRLERIEGYLRQIAEDLHAMRKAQAAELKLILALLPSQKDDLSDFLDESVKRVATMEKL